MRPQIVHYLSTLKALESADRETCEKIIRNCEPEVILAIIEIALNILFGNVNLNQQEFESLKEHKHCLRQLAYPYVKRKQGGFKRSTKGGLQKRKKLCNFVNERKLLLQQGTGFWGALLVPVVSELSSYLITKALSKK